MNTCPRCGSDLHAGEYHEGGQHTNNHHILIYECRECGWSNVNR